MIKRNQRLVFRYYKPNKNLHPEKFAYHLRLLFYPFFKENDLFSSDQTYSQKHCAIVNESKQIFEPNSELIYTLLTEISMQDQEKHFYNDQQHESSEFNEQERNEQEGSTAQVIEANRQLELSNEELSNLILTLKTQQRKIFNEVQYCTRKKSKL